MLTIFNLPKKLVRILGSNSSPNQIASGFCLGMFFGFMPLSWAIIFFLTIGLFILKINRLAVALAWSLFKLFYIFGINKITYKLGSFLLTDLDWLTSTGESIARLPVFSLLDLSNPVVCGGLLLSTILAFPLFIISKKFIILSRDNYLENVKKSKIYKFFIKIPLIKTILSILRII